MTNQAADEIKERITMPEVLSRYGLSANARGFLRCPFHEEKTASLKIYGEGRKWKCFGCGRGGSAIDFVMELYHISFSQAVVRMQNDFGLFSKGIDWTSREKQKRLEKRRAEEKELSRYRAEYEDHCLEFYNAQYLWKHLPKPKQGEPFSEDYGKLLAGVQAYLTHLEEWFCEHPWR